MCRLAMRVDTSNRSGELKTDIIAFLFIWTVLIFLLELTLEAWLPTNWAGRFLSTGNGGVSGCIQCMHSQRSQRGPLFF